MLKSVVMAYHFIGPDGPDTKIFFSAVRGIWIPLALAWCSQASEALSQKPRFLAQDQLEGLQKIFFLFN